MKKLILITSGILILIVTEFETSYSQQLPDSAYFGQIPPGLTPKVFAPGLISLSGRRDTKIVFSPDGLECFIGTVLNSTFTFLYTKQTNGHWSDPVQADFLGTSDKREPFISPDGQKLFFVRNANIYVSIKDVNQQWSTPSKLASPVNSSAQEWHPTVTSDGTLYFCSTRTNPMCIYRSQLENGQYRTVGKLDSTINSQYGAGDPYIAPNENYLIFSSTWPDGYGESDQYISYHNGDGIWTNPENLGSAINTNGIEYGSYISYDDKYYFFSRPAGWGPNIEADIYWIDACVIFDDTLTGLNEIKKNPDKFKLNQNYPNPFNASTIITYSIPYPGYINLEVYDSLGRMIMRLVNEFKQAGIYSVNINTNYLSSSVYFYRLKIGSNLVDIKKMLLIK
jgi:hypothetical protein